MIILVRKETNAYVLGFYANLMLDRGNLKALPTLVSFVIYSLTPSAGYKRYFSAEHNLLNSLLTVYCM